MESFISNNIGQTKKIARDLAKKILKSKVGKTAMIVGLMGELGSGKTTFVQGFAGGLNVKTKILSPTFVLMRRHGNFYHLDAYRVKKAKEILDLGWKELVNNSQNIILVEWAEKIKKILPKNCIKIYFKHVDRNKRKINIA
jgi:tRNA threonylcarbamoyladenosine biosynthesis protein TsaE